MAPRSSPSRCLTYSRVPSFAVAFAIVLTAVTLTRVAPAAEPDRALDATCAWGRLSDGKGRLVRCLSRDEAARLRDPAPVVAPPAPSPAPSAPFAPSAPPMAMAAPSESAPPTESPPAESELVAEVGSVVADEGALPDALKSFKKVRDRYVECADKNGGLTADRGEVELRFLVQSKGRAEGVSVKKRRGLSEAAGKCIAGVVDRRYVGYPEAPAVGASVTVAITKKKR